MNSLELGRFFATYFENPILQVGMTLFWIVAGLGVVLGALNKKAWFGSFFSFLFIIDCLSNFVFVLGATKVSQHMALAVVALFMRPLLKGTAAALKTRAFQKVEALQLGESVLGLVLLYLVFPISKPPNHP